MTAVCHRRFRNFTGNLLLRADQPFCRNRFLAHEADATEHAAADEPFGVDHMGQDADCREEHPGDKHDDGGENRPERGLAGAVLGSIHGHEYDDGEGRHERQAGHEGGNDAADGEGEAQGQQAEQEDGNPRDPHVAAVVHVRLDKPFVDVVGIERRRRQEQVAGRADIGRPQGGQGNARDPRIEAHDEAGQGRRRRDARVQLRRDDAEQGGDEADGQHDEAAVEEPALRRPHIPGAQGNLDDGLQGQIDRDEDDNPRHDGHAADTADQIQGVDRRRLDGHDIDPAGQAQDQESRHGNADILERHVQDIRLAGGPHAADEGDADEDDGAGQHARQGRKQVGQEGRQDGAAGHVLQAHDDELHQDLAGNARHQGPFVIVPFQQFRHGRDVELAVLFRDREAHDDGADAPGRRVPACRQAHFVGLFRHADRGRAAHGEPDDGHENQRRRQLAPCQDIRLGRRRRPVLHIRADAEQHGNVGDNDENLYC